MSQQVLISLTRDWLGRENPDAYPAHGFFPVWAFTLLIIAGKLLYSFLFFILRAICGIVS